MPVRRDELDVVHRAVFGWPMDSLTPVELLTGSESLHEATCKLLATDRARNLLSSDISIWPTDKWVCVDFFGLRVWLNLRDSFVGRGVLNHDWENDEVDFVLSQLLPGDAVIDVGANIGVYTLRAAQAVGPNGMVYAFEPQTDIYQMLRRSIAENGFDGRCQTFNLALGDREKRASIWRHHEINPGASIVTDEVVVGAGNEINVRRLDDIGIERPVKLLKMDIEGYEPLLVRGGESFFRRHRPVILTEWFPRSMTQVAHCSSEAYFDQLESLGYHIHHLAGASLGARMMRSEVLDYETVERPFNIVCMPTG